MARSGWSPEVAVRPPLGGIRFDFPLPTVILALALGGVALVAGAAVAIAPFDAAMFGGLTVPTVLGAGVLDGLNPCAFALLVLFATYTLTLVNSVTSEGSPTALARRRLLGAGSLYVGAVWITYFLIGLGLFAFLSWLGEDHLITRIAAVLALVMALWMVKDILLPGWGPALAAPHATHGWMHRAMERGGLGGMLLAGVLCNESQLVREDGRLKVQGDPTEAAMLVAAEKGGVGEDVREGARVQSEVHVV